MRPGDRVDVIVNYQKRGMRGQPTTTTATLLKYIEVFSTDNKTVSDSAAKQTEVKTKVVSLILTPAQVNIIMLARSKGTLGLAWRHPDDNEDVEGTNVDENLLSELSGLDTAKEDDILTLDRRGPALFDEDSAKQPVAEPQDGLKKLLDEGAQAAVVAAPAKQMWKIQIYQGDTPVEQQFELAQPANAASEAGAGGQETLTDAFRWLHQQFTGGAAPAEPTGATGTSL